MKVVCRFAGKEVAPTEQMGCILFSVSKEEMRSVKDKTLRFTIDGNKITVGEMAVTFKEDDGIRHIKGFYIRMDLIMLARIANAKKTEGSLGTKKFQLKPAHQSAIKDFVNYFAPIQPKK